MKAFSNQHSAIRLALVALVGLALTGCSLFGGGGKGNDPEFRLSDLQGLWLENGDSVLGHHVRFTTEQSDESGYFWGCEWTESDDVYEDYLVFHGNGWFKYSFKSAELIEIHKMDGDWADIPKVYTVTTLTDTDLKYYEKDHPASKFKFSKVVETK